MPIPAHIQQAIQAYYAERATDDEIAALEDWLRADEANVRIFAEHGMLEWQLLCEAEKADAAAILSMLREAEDNAEPDFSLLHKTTFEPEPAKADDNALTLGEVCSIAGYAIAKGLRTRAGIIGSLAAVFVIGAALYLAIFGLGPTPAPQKSADNTPTKPAASAQPLQRGSNTTPPVATLTATHHATWAERALARGSLKAGSKLHPNTRLTLTTGFAEITTARGAIAILQAPATIELIDSPNALRLHTGKLVGICETQSSKGFLVRTPHMDVTDLGTAFGVEVSASGQAEVHVLTGEVRVSTSRDDANPRPLLAGQAVAASGANRITDITYDHYRFVPDMATAALKPDFGDTNAVWLGQVSGDLSQDKRRADALQVFIEQRGLLLDRAVPTDFNRETPWDPAKADTHYEVPAGEQVDVYLLHFDLLSGHQQTEAFVLDFDRPIVGVIISQELLDATDETFGVAGVTYPVFNTIPEMLMGGQRGLNYRANVTDIDEATLTLTNDGATISPDGTRLNLRLWGGEDPTTAKMDQVRVLVRSDRYQTDSNNTDPVGLPTH